MADFEDLKMAVESLSGGKNTVLLDDMGMPSIVVPFPKINYSDVIEGGAQEALPAFIVDGQEKAAIYISKYENVILNDRAYSLALKTPAANVDFARAVEVCTNKGAGWHLTTNAAWAAIVLQSRANGFILHGNTDNGKDYTHTDESGVGGVVTATGSGPSTWYHNNDLAGIADLVGNLREWVSGLRLVNGEIQVIPYGNAMKYDCNMSATSTHWKAISSGGVLVEPGTADTIKMYEADSRIYVSNSNTVGAGTGAAAFGMLTAADGVTPPTLLTALGLFPNGIDCIGGVSINTDGEFLPCRGGNFADMGHAGPFALDIDNTRTTANAGIGFRASYYK